MSELEALKKAVLVLEGQTALAAVCGNPVKQQHVHNWIHRDKKIPAQHALKVQNATEKKGDRVDASELRPDVFGCMPCVNVQRSAATS